MKKIKKGDLILISVCIVICFVLLLFLPKNKGEYAVIYVNGDAVKTVNLTQDTDFFQGNVEITVKSGEIWVTNSPCPDKICINTGKISKAGEIIACLPEKTVIVIKGKSSPDGVTG